MTTAHDVKCPRCGRLLLKVDGMAHIETKCRHCKITVHWPTPIAFEEKTGQLLTESGKVAPKNT